MRKINLIKRSEKQIVLDVINTSIEIAEELRHYSFGDRMACPERLTDWAERLEASISGFESGEETPSNTTVENKEDLRREVLRKGFRYGIGVD